MNDVFALVLGWAFWAVKILLLVSAVYVNTMCFIRAVPVKDAESDTKAALRMVVFPIAAAVFLVVVFIGVFAWSPL